MLWDVIQSPNTKVSPVKHVGGAPANFAYHAHQLGARCEIISAVGKDSQGDALVKEIAKLGVSTRGIQKCPFFPTGSVSVKLQEDDEPEYNIHEGVAWDDIEPTPDALLFTQHAEIIYYGTLAQRSQKSKDAIQRLLKEGNPKACMVYDVNIRQQYYTNPTLMESLRSANIVKVNDQDLTRLSHAMGVSEKHETFAKAIFQRFPKAEVIAITSGDAGSTLLTRDGGMDIREAMDIKAVDTVGAGDAFTAVVALGWHRHMPLEAIHQLAVAVASYVCTQPGATPPLPERFHQEMGY